MFYPALYSAVVPVPRAHILLWSPPHLHLQPVPETAGTPLITSSSLKIKLLPLTR